MNIIEERDRRTVIRKIRKREYDDVITLSVPDHGQTVRLLDEGAVVDANGRLDFYIMKGTLKRYLEALPDDYEGSINIGHNTFATFPFLVGKWTKEDLSLVDIGDGRMGLDVDLRLDDESMFVRELRRANYTLGVSAEFTYHINEELSNEYGFAIMDEVFIRDFAIVGDAGNVNSSGIELKGDNKMDFQKLMNALGEDGEVKDLAAVNAILDSVVESGEKKEAAEPVEEPEKELDAEVEAEPEKELEAEAEEEPVEELEAEAEEEETEKLAEEPEDNGLAELSAAIEKLMERVDALEAENASLTEKLSAKEKTEQDFVSKFKSLTVSLTKERKAPESKKDAVEYTDGIGE